MKHIGKALRNGEIIIGVCCDISDPSAVEMLGHAGWDFVIINAEGGTMTPYGAELENQIRAAYRADIVPVVKVPKNDAPLIASALNLGAKIIEVPKISTKADLLNAIQAAYYPPKGNRMTCWGVPATKYGLTSWAQHVKEANDEILIYPILEEKAAMENMEDILSVDGLTIVGLGFLDLQLRLGGVGDKGAEDRMKIYEKKLIDLCNSKNLHLIKGVRDAASMKEAISMGCRGVLFAYDDLTLLYNASVKALGELRQAAKDAG